MSTSDVRDALTRIWNSDDYSGLAPAVGTTNESTAMKFLTLVNGYKAALPTLRFVQEDDREGALTSRWRAEGVHSGWLLGCPPSFRTIGLGGKLLERGRIYQCGDTCDDWNLREFLQATGVSRRAFERVLHRPEIGFWLRANCSAPGTATLLFPTPALPGWLSWKRVTDALRQQRPVVTFQLYSNISAFWKQLNPEGYGPASESRRLERELRQSGMPLSFDVVAHSLGAPVAVVFAFRNPHWIRSVTLIEPIVGSLLADSVERSDVAAFIAMRASCYRTPISTTRYGRFLTDIHAGDYDPVRTALWPMLAAHRDNVRCRRQLLWNDCTAEHIARLRIPVLIVQGRRSNSVQRLIADRMSRLLTKCAVVEMEGGHAPHAGESGARTFAQLFAEFTNRLPSSTGEVGEETQ